MKILNEYLEARLIKRYKRFLADVELQDGTIITVHTPNTGSMKGCADPGSRVWIYKAENPKRKYAFSWELVEDLNGNKIGIHTGRVNQLVIECIESGVCQSLQGYESIKAEVKYLDSNTRFDLFLSSHKNQKDCFVEIKNVTAKRDEDTAIFPDAKTTRGQKHLSTLIDAVDKGYRAVMFFCIQREDVKCFSPADEIDETYGELLRFAEKEGVEIIAYKAQLAPDNIVLTQPVPIRL